MAIRVSNSFDYNLKLFEKRLSASNKERAERLFCVALLRCLYTEHQNQCWLHIRINTQKVRYAPILKPSSNWSLLKLIISDQTFN